MVDSGNRGSQKFQVWSLKFAMRTMHAFQLPRIVRRAAVVRVSHVTLLMSVPTAVGRASCFLCVYYGSDEELSLSRGQRLGSRARVHTPWLACVTQEAGKYSAVLMADLSELNS